MYGQTGSGKTFTMMGQYSNLLGGNANSENTSNINSKASPRVGIRSNQIVPLRTRDYSTGGAEREIRHLNYNTNPEKGKK